MNFDHYPYGWKVGANSYEIRQHILEVILHKKPKKIQEIHEGEK